MSFPSFQVPYAGNGMVIGVNAIIHVLISHGIAIGLFSLIVVGDWVARTSSYRDEWDALNRRLLKFTVVTTTTIGAVTGVGIWLTTSALAPRAVGSMLRVFFWPWFTEWLVFVLEVVILLLYYFSWDKLGVHRRRRIAFGVGYMLLALCSAVLITGILGFMLTPGEWPSTFDFWSAFLNPSYAPQLVTRLAISFVVGAVVALLFVVTQRGIPRAAPHALVLYGSILGVSSVVLVAGGAWYMWSVPRFYLERSLYSVLTAHLSHAPWVFWGANVLALGLLLSLIVGAFRRRSRWVRLWVIPALVGSIGLVAQFERIREFVRGPYLMPGYMYVSSILLAERPHTREAGLASSSYWYPHVMRSGTGNTLGAHVFSSSCSACHTVDGINGITRRVQGRTEDGVYVMVGHIHEMVSFMPPFSGSDEERRALAQFLYDLTNRRGLVLKSRSRHVPEGKPR